MQVIRMLGRVLMDREALAQWTGYSEKTIQRHCLIVGRDPKDFRALYNAPESRQRLEDLGIAKRRRVA